MIKQNFDLHTHSNASDGSFSPTDLVRKAKAEGLSTLALIDHDTVSGVKEAMAAGVEQGIFVIPGVEISIDFQPGTMHICGYFIDIKDRRLREGLAFVQEARRNRNPQIITKLNQLGLKITLDEVRQVAGPDQVGRPHFAKVLVQKGYVQSTKEAFTKYLAKGAPAYMDKKRLSLDDAVAMIRAAGGVAVLAHPILLGWDRTEDFRATFIRLLEAGVEGIEAFNSYQTEEQNWQFYEMARDLDLIVTAGSDFHGDTNPDFQLGEFGKAVPIGIEEIVEQLQGKREKLKVKSA